MERISTATRAIDLYGAGKDGFKDGDLPNSILPTDLNAAWFNHVQEELARIVEGSGQVLDAGELSQVTKAIKRFAGANVKTVTAGVSALTVDDAGAVLVDASGGNVTLNLPASNVVAGLGIEFTFYRTDATVNSVTVNRAGADTIDGGVSFTLPGQFAYRTIRGDGNAVWSTTSLASTASSSKIQGISVAMNTPVANAMTITIDPTSLDVRSSALSVGVPNTRTSAAPIAIVVPAGATLGSTNGQPARLLISLIDNAGVLEGALGNQAGGVDFSETNLHTTTTLSAASDSANVVYSMTGRASVPYRVVGCVELTQAVAGNWTTPPTLIQGAGGMALAAMQSLGFGQTWQSVTRSPGVTYYNTTGKPIQLVWNINAAAAASCLATVSINGGVAIPLASVGAGTGPTAVAGSIIIPVGASYIVAETNVTARSTFELR
jgi:hypothetical protein